jgi:hypothetical protein
MPDRANIARSGPLLSFALTFLREAENAGLQVRLMGSLAVEYRCSHMAGFEEAAHTPKDIDLVCTRASYEGTHRRLEGEGLTSNREIEAASEGRRAIFLSADGSLLVDLFAGELEFCHRLDVEKRIAVDAVTLPLADLLLLKLQRVELRPEDRDDVARILCQFPVGEHDGEMINVGRMREVLAGDWGFWRTATANLPSPSDPSWPAKAAERAAGIRRDLDSAPKTLRWKIRSWIGGRLKWYRDVEQPNFF